ncbi:hypothetical protein KBB96_03970 [Luteolibacter ambystomatis]|uniref:Uncharacterized protein n=1 Tax=Luteolibacter ambystomatis TaxID=2824561 RepID=A0A975J112_9BACT|nr:hypothetical protein [Luteolibacter ambystomatis]QUE52050.1 hypothetical protein KBB96_03970 [Luteolibacter ambystomatis]
MAHQRGNDPWYHYKVFTHLWQPPAMEEARLIVISRTEMTQPELRDLLVRSGRAVAGGVWTESVEPGSLTATGELETPEDYILIGELSASTPGNMPARPTDRDPTVDYPFQQRA